MTLTGLLTTAAGLSSASQTGEKPSVTDLKVFGCSIEFLHMATQTYLEDPIWDKLQQSMEYCIIFKDCSKVRTPRRVSHPQHPACCPRPHERE